jgi:hypothetical protein
MGDPLGEADRGALRLDFNRRLMLQFRGSVITSDAGLSIFRNRGELATSSNCPNDLPETSHLSGRCQDFRIVPGHRAVAHISRNPTD